MPAGASALPGRVRTRLRARARRRRRWPTGSSGGLERWGRRWRAVRRCSSLQKTRTTDRRGCLCAQSRAENLRKSEDHEAGILSKIPPPKTPRLRAETEEPLEPAALHPARGLWFCPGEKIERRAHPEHDRLHASAMRVHPAILLGG